MKKTTTKTLYIPIPTFTILFIIYSIAMGLRNDVGWLLLGAVCFVLDLILTSGFTHVTTRIEETKEE